MKIRKQTMHKYQYGQLLLFSNDAYPYLLFNIKHLNSLKITSSFGHLTCACITKLSWIKSCLFANGGVWLLDFDLRVCQVMQINLHVTDFIYSRYTHCFSSNITLSKRKLSLLHHYYYTVFHGFSANLQAASMTGKHKLKQQ